MRSKTEALIGGFGAIRVPRTREKAVAAHLGIIGVNDGDLFWLHPVRRILAEGARDTYWIGLHDHRRSAGRRRDCLGFYLVRSFTCAVQTPSSTRSSTGSSRGQSDSPSPDRSMGNMRTLARGLVDGASAAAPLEGGNVQTLNVEAVVMFFAFVAAT